MLALCWVMSRQMKLHMRARAFTADGDSIAHLHPTPRYKHVTTHPSPSPVTWLSRVASETKTPQINWVDNQSFSRVVHRAWILATKVINKGSLHANQTHKSLRLIKTNILCSAKASLYTQNVVSQNLALGDSCTTGIIQVATVTAHFAFP